jgi:hypothetical protein
MDGDPGAFFRQLQCDAAADAARGPGDERVLARE